MEINKNKLFEEYEYILPEDNTVNALVGISHDIAKSKGWWKVGEKPLSEIIALIHSELSEGYDYAMEAVKQGEEQFDDHLPDQSGFAVELADAIIRVFDYFGWKGYNFAEIVKGLWLGGSAENKSHKPKIMTVKHITNTYSLNSVVGNHVFAFIGSCHSYLSKALEANRKDDNDEDIKNNMARMVINCFVFSDQRFGAGVLESIILQKLNYNMHRKPMHGKKY